MRWLELVALMGKVRNVYSILVGKPERKTPFGKTRRRWEDNIKLDLTEVGLGMWIRLVLSTIGTTVGIS
jgi:hypothetical protein